MNVDKALIGRRSQLFRRLLKCRDILPGSFIFRASRCGKSNCICHKEESRLHAFHQYNYKIDEKPVTKYIPKEYARQVERQVLTNKEFKKIIKGIHKINLELLFNQLERVKNNKKVKTP